MTVRLLSIFSLLALFTLAISHGHSEEWLRRFDSAPRSNKEEVINQIIIEAESLEDETLRFTAERVMSGEDDQLLRNLLLRRIQLENRSPEVQSSNSKAKEILRNPVFQDSESREGSNWIQRAMQRLSELFKPKESYQPDLPNLSNQGILNLGGIFPFILGILIVALLFAMVLALHKVSLKKSAKAKKTRGGILEEDEPIRSHDEWLTLASQLESQGKFREAIRCLYLAVLMRLDESRIVRFERTETNWEHLYRIESSAAPKEVKYRRLTQKFDLAWYGSRPCNSDDTTEFRSEYLKLTESIRSKVK